MFKKPLKSIKVIELSIESEWRTLPLDETIAKVANLKAVSHLNKMLLFGGLESASF